MADKLHFLISETRAICNEPRIGIQVTDDPAKVLVAINPETKLGIAAEGACQDCANCLAVTTLHKPAKPKQMTISPVAAKPAAAPAATPAEKKV